MKNTCDFLDELRTKLSLKSDGQLADYLGIHRQHMSRYRTMAHAFDDSMALRVAELLESDPAYILCCMHHQRSKLPAIKAVWQRVADITLPASGAIILCLAVFPFLGVQNEIFPAAFAGVISTGLHDTMYIMLNGNIAPAIAVISLILIVKSCTFKAQ